MFNTKEIFDEIGPQRVVHVYDQSAGLKAMLVIDTMIYGRYGGGVRMVNDLTIEELCGLARAMTYKFGILGIPRGGAKLGILADHNVKGKQRKKILEAFGRAIKPFLLSGLGTGADIGIFEDDLDVIFQGAGIKRPGVGLSKFKIHGDPLEYYTTSFGVFNSILAGCDLIKRDIKGAKVAIEGFGKVGNGVAFFLKEAGATVVAISTIEGAIYNEKGLDVLELIRLRKKYGDHLVHEYKDAQGISNKQIHFLPVDILVPGARPDVITKQNVPNVRAKVIASAANNPITDEAEQILFDKNIVVVPDFISNAGGTIFAMMDRLGRKPREVFPVIAAMIKPLSKEILLISRKKGLSPKTVALKRIQQQLRKASKDRQIYSDKMFSSLLYERFSL